MNHFKELLRLNRGMLRCRLRRQFAFYRIILYYFPLHSPIEYLFERSHGVMSNRRGLILNTETLKLLHIGGFEAFYFPVAEIRDDMIPAGPLVFPYS